MSVYGTGRNALDNKQIFLQVCLPALSAQPKPCGTVGFQSPYVLQPSIPSDGGSVTPRSLPCLYSECRNINRLVIAYPSRVRLSPRLTLIRLTLFRKPWVFGVYISIIHYRYLCLHLLFCTLQHPSRVHLQRCTQCSPTTRFSRVQSFGGSLDARSSSTQLRSTSELLRTL